MHIKTYLTAFMIVASTPVFAQFELDKKPSNIAEQPVWGPIGFNYVSAYYLPQHDIYYVIGSQEYYIKQSGKWEAYKALPRKYGTINLFTTYKYVIQDGAPHPFQWHKKHKKDASASSKSKQVPILDAVKYDDRYKLETGTVSPSN